MLALPCYTKQCLAFCPSIDDTEEVAMVAKIIVILLLIATLATLISLLCKRKEWRYTVLGRSIWMHDGAMNVHNISKDVAVMTTKDAQLTYYECWYSTQTGNEICFEYGSFGTPKSLIAKARASLLQQGRNGKMPIHDASAHNHEVLELLKDGFLVAEQLAARDFQGMMAVHHAAATGTRETFNILRSVCDDDAWRKQLAAVDASGYTPLHHAFLGSNVDVINEILGSMGNAKQLDALIASLKDEKWRSCVMGYLAMHPMYPERAWFRDAIVSLFTQGAELPTIGDRDMIDGKMQKAMSRVLREVCVDHGLYNRVNDAILLGIQHSGR
jgi:hypothetical protein